MLPLSDGETVVDDLPSAEVDAGLIDIVDGCDVAQKEHGLLIEVYDHASLLQWLRGFWVISTVVDVDAVDCAHGDEIGVMIAADA
jgi:hypothetical protein